MFLRLIMFRVLREETKTLRVGIPRAYFYDDLDDEVRAAVDEALAVIKTLVAETREVQIEIPTDRVVQNAESYAVHADHCADAGTLSAGDSAAHPLRC
jgi:Asp-tRNA(Asn)/Glu-tRNA(Gln) amidotransferase A subunit family amidase